MSMIFLQKAHGKIRLRHSTSILCLQGRITEDRLPKAMQKPATADKLAAKICKTRKIKLARFKKIKKFISISNKHLRIVDIFL